MFDNWAQGDWVPYPEEDDFGKTYTNQWGIIGNCAGVLAQLKGFLRANTEVNVRGQGLMRVHPQVKVGMWTM